MPTVSSKFIYLLGCFVSSKYTGCHVIILELVPSLCLCACGVSAKT